MSKPSQLPQRAVKNLRRNKVRATELVEQLQSCLPGMVPRSQSPEGILQRSRLEAKTECMKAGAKEDDILAIAGDITKEEVRNELVDKTIAKFGKLNILVSYYELKISSGAP
uniref:Uncharacterized protein n=1 Tax=Parascaris equorum TaxID=6256 RepID=A0A914RF36_PAREQ